MSILRALMSLAVVGLALSERPSSFIGDSLDVERDNLDIEALLGKIQQDGYDQTQGEVSVTLGASLDVPSVPKALQLGKLFSSAFLLRLKSKLSNTGTTDLYFCIDSEGKEELSALLGKVLARVRTSFSGDRYQGVTSKISSSSRAFDFTNVINAFTKTAMLGMPGSAFTQTVDTYCLQVAISPALEVTVFGYLAWNLPTILDALKANPKIRDKLEPKLNGLGVSEVGLSFQVFPLSLDTSPTLCLGFDLTNTVQLAYSAFQAIASPIAQMWKRSSTIDDATKFLQNICETGNKQTLQDYAAMKLRQRAQDMLERNAKKAGCEGVIDKLGSLKERLYKPNGAFPIDELSSIETGTQGSITADAYLEVSLDALWSENPLWETGGMGFSIGGSWVIDEYCVPWAEALAEYQAYLAIEQESHSPTKFVLVNAGKAKPGEVVSIDVYSVEKGQRGCANYQVKVPHEGQFVAALSGAKPKRKPA